MTPGQEMQVQEKRELQKNEESTMPVRAFVPAADIYETDQALTVVMEMPGVEKANLDVHVENDVLNVVGHIDVSKYEKLQPVYTEYNIGHYRRSFSLSLNNVDQEKIQAEMKDGVLTLTLPRAERAKARRITIG
jgi:HSP20 family protein